MELVDRNRLESEIARVADEVSRDVEGIFGPNSTTWSVDRERVLLLGGGAAALLQLADPVVAAAVWEHSAARTDPIGRFQRTFQAVHAMVFGDLSHAFTAARRLHARHRAVHGVFEESVGRYRAGDRYRANELGSLRWVHATLLKTSLQVHNLVLGSLTRTQSERYYRESFRFASLFGIRPNDQPSDLAAFTQWFSETLRSDRIVVSRPARTIADQLLRPATPLHRPLTELYRAVTAGLLPERLREPFGLSFGERERLRYARVIAAVRAMYPRLPAAVRHVPAYLDADRRSRGLGPSRLRPGRALEAMLLRLVRPFS